MARLMRAASGLMNTMRPVLKQAIPRQLHRKAGSIGRKLVNLFESVDAIQAPSWRVLPKYNRATVDCVVFVADGLPAGGAERQLVNLLRGWRRVSGHQPHLICFRLAEEQAQNFYADLLRESGVQPRNAGSERDAIAILAKMCGALETKAIVASLTWAPRDLQGRIIRLVAEYLLLRPSVVYGWQDACGLASAVAALIAGVPLIVVVTRNLNPSRFDYHRSFMRSLFVRLAEEPRVQFVNNSVAGAVDYEAWLRLPAGRFRIVRNGVDVSGFHRARAEDVSALRAAFGVPDKARIIGGVFRLETEKRPSLWIQAASLVAERRPDVYFILFGEGPLKPRLARQVAKAGARARIRLAGATTDAARAMSAFDLLLLTSQYEGTPNVILEAGALGVPVVCTMAGGVEETVLPGRTGVLVPSRDRDVKEQAEAIADVLLAALDDPILARAAASDGPRFVQETYGLERMIREIYAIAAASAVQTR